MRNDSCFWAVSALASAVVAAVFLVLLIFGQLMDAAIGIWIAAAVAVIVLLILLLRAPTIATAAPAVGGMAAPAPVQPCHGRLRCYTRWIGVIAAAAATVGFGAAFLAAVPYSVAAYVFFFLAVMAFTFKLIAVVAYAACRLS